MRLNLFLASISFQLLPLCWASLALSAINVVPDFGLCGSNFPITVLGYKKYEKHEK
jgi:hypothetical protein